jgi:mRNA-degrading endonuclease RelE of RelBE toxin-antitoxin system
LAYTPKLSDPALKYLNKLDKPTAKRIAEKIQALTKDPFNFRLSKPLTSSFKRSARVGDYRILFVLESIPANGDNPQQDFLVVAEIGPRGRVYRDA